MSSYCAAKRAIAKHGLERITLLFADTGIEDSDNYRFLEESAHHLNAPLVRVKNSRYSTVWDNWRGKKAISSDRMPFCSFDMKHDPCREWVSNHTSPSDVFIVGISWDEIHRLPGIEQGWFPNPVLAPLTEPPYLDKPAQLQECLADGITPPRLYDYGLPHANCGGGCVRAGITHWMHLYRVLPEVFAEWEAQEARARDELGINRAMLRDRRGGKAKPYPLSQLRRDIESGDRPLPKDEWGGCGCFSEMKGGHHNG